jgi:hypothetical protein
MPAADAAESLLTAHCGTTAVAVWRRKPLHATFAQQQRALRETVERFPGQATFLCIIEEDCWPCATSSTAAIELQHEVAGLRRKPVAVQR